MDTEILHTPNHAMLNVTYSGMNGNYPDPVPYDMDDTSIKRIVTEGLTTNYVPGIQLPHGTAIDLTDFVIDRFPATSDLPPRLMCRPKTPFGG